MKTLTNTKTLVIAALLTAFTCISTMIIQIPTPSLGYIHLGDALVLLCGILLGPVLGSLSAGLGSMLADLLSGYVIYAIPTFIIKAVTALIVSLLFAKIRQSAVKKDYFSLALAGFFAEANMVFGYFLNSIIQTMFLSGSYQPETFYAGVTTGLAGLFPNSIQGLVGIIIVIALLPFLKKIPDVRSFLYSKN